MSAWRFYKNLEKERRKPLNRAGGVVRAHENSGVYYAAVFCALCRCFADSPCAAGAEARCSHFVNVPHIAAHGTITSRGAEHRSRKTKPLHPRQRTHAALLAPARSFRGHGGIETPMFLVLLTPKEHRPLLTPKEHNPFDSEQRLRCLAIRF